MSYYDTPEGKIELARRRLELGASYPYDRPDVPDDLEEEPPPPPAKDWAHAAARGIIADLCDRRGIKHEFRGVDPDIRVEIVESLAEIIRQAAIQADKEVS